MPDGAVEVLVDNLDREFIGDITITVSGDHGAGSQRTGTVQRLTASAPESASDTTFGGAVTASDGSFSPTSVESIEAVAGIYRRITISGRRSGHRGVHFKCANTIPI